MEQKQPMKNSRKVCFYVMTADTGFAPNPFRRYCTLAACTPNHCRANLKKGDLISGCFRSKGVSQLVYVMEVDEFLPLDGYWRALRFAGKKPVKNGTPEEQAGDNLYHKHHGRWIQDGNALYHRKPPEEEFDLTLKPRPAWIKDVRGNRVFVGRRFVYFGGKAVDLPDQFIPCLPAGQGIKYLREDGDPDLFNRFLKWAFTRPKLKRLGKPRDMPKDMRTKASCGCKRDGCSP